MSECMPVTHPPPWKYTITGRASLDLVSGVYHLTGTILEPVVFVSSTFLTSYTLVALKDKQVPADCAAGIHNTRGTSVCNRRTDANTGPLPCGVLASRWQACLPYMHICATFVAQTGATLQLQIYFSSLIALLRASSGVNVS